ncbi:MAG: hypothetical protein A2W35_00030 [Chloroflexi bacterium RBG_16_57_11]|nr:MAG: hypothetical protein A2W35_00030 [Chloroflexi bacterium RBG_16_57_11]
MFPEFDTDFIEPEYESLSWWQSWLSAVTKPSVATFDKIANDPQASTIRAALWIFFSSLVGMFISVPLALIIYPQLLTILQDAVGEFGSAMAAAVSLMLCLVPLSAALSVVGMMISSALIQLTARLLGGQGTFEGTFNCLAAIASPITPVTSVLSVIPFVGSCLSAPLSMYALVLYVVGVKASNRFGWGAAIGAVLLPGLVVGGLCCCLVFAISAVFGAAVQDLVNQGAIPVR